MTLILMSGGKLVQLRPTSHLSSSGKHSLPKALQGSHNWVYIDPDTPSERDVSLDPSKETIPLALTASPFGANFVVAASGCDRKYLQSATLIHNVRTWLEAAEKARKESVLAAKKEAESKAAAVKKAAEEKDGKAGKEKEMGNAVDTGIESDLLSDADDGGAVVSDPIYQKPWFLIDNLIGMENIAYAPENWVQERFGDGFKIMLFNRDTHAMSDFSGAVWEEVKKNGALSNGDRVVAAIVYK